MLTVVTYHYVRDLAASAFPEIKGLDVTVFDRQLDYLAANYEVCSLDRVREALAGGDPLPPAACVLTFDDGLVDHLAVVTPRLHRRGWSGVFFASAHLLEGPAVLDVHKIQFILAAVPNVLALVEEVLRLTARFRDEHGLPDDSTLLQRHCKQSIFDDPDTHFVKSMLQRHLPAAVRRVAVDDLFRVHVTEDEAAFAQELYLSTAQCREMVAAGMEIGGHGYRHERMGLMDGGAQEREISRSRELMERVYGGGRSRWSYCYPHGSYDELSLELLAAGGFDLAFTLEEGANVTLRAPLQLLRVDTNTIAWEQAQASAG